MKKQTIGIAGYMGCGKTTFTKFLLEHGGCEINADLEAKKLMAESKEIKRKIAAVFGEDILTEDTIRFDILGPRAFVSQKSINDLNTIIHPVLKEYLRSMIDSKSDPVIILDAALIPLWNIDSWFDYRIWVDASFMTRLNRLMQKQLTGTIDRNEMERRMTIQQQLFNPPQRDSWIYIENENTLDDLRYSVNEIIKAAPGLNQALNRKSAV